MTFYFLSHQKNLHCGNSPGTPFINIVEIKSQHRWTASRLGHVTSLGQPRSGYKGGIACRYLSRTDHMTLKVSQWSPWYQLRESQDAYLVQDSSSNPSQVIAWTSQISYISRLKWPKWPWGSLSITAIFNTSCEYPKMHVWYKFSDSSLNLWCVMAQTNQNS